MNKVKILAWALVFAMLLAGCGGDVWNVERSVGESEVYSVSDIESAMNVVVRFFAANYSGCTLTELRYDEEVSAKAASEWAEQYDAEEAIVLLSRFEVDGSGDSPALNPNSTYEDYKWVLTRSGGSWSLQTWGY